MSDAPAPVTVEDFKAEGRRIVAGYDTGNMCCGTYMSMSVDWIRRALKALPEQQVLDFR